MQSLTDLQQADVWVKAQFGVSLLLVLALSLIPVILVYPAARAFRGRQDINNIRTPVLLAWGMWFLFPFAPYMLATLFWEALSTFPRWSRVLLPVLVVVVFLQPVLLPLWIWLAGAPSSLVLTTFLVVWLGPILLSWWLLIGLDLIIQRLPRSYARSGHSGPVRSDDGRGGTYAGLRALALATRRSELDGSVTSEGPVYGMLMELGFSEGASTLFALADGHTSLYGSGGGYLGGGLHENVRQFVGPFIATANRCLGQMQAVDAFPVPQAGQATFYALTDSGVLTAGGRQQELVDDSHPLSALYHDGHQVFTQLRYMKWRSPALSMLVPAPGTDAPSAESVVHGVHRETGLGSAITFGILALGDGRAGVYTTQTEGTIFRADQLSQNLRQANASLVEVSNQAVQYFQPADCLPVPADGYTTFYVGTRAGIISASALTADLEAGHHPLSPLYRAGEGVLEQGRLAFRSERTDN
jgi:hypothetical protein